MKIKPDYKKLFEIAEPQGGYFTTHQARAAGYSRKDVSSLASSNKFSRIAYGVYRITYYPSTDHEDLIIAILKSGPDAVVSNDSALSVYQLSDVLPGSIHITIPKTRSRRQKGITYHTCRITDQEITSYNGLPITTVERTITDVVRSGLDELLVQQSIDQAIKRGMITTDSLQNQVNKYGKKIKNDINKFIDRFDDD